MKLANTTRMALAAAALATVACSDANDSDRTPPVGAEGRNPTTVERDYAADRETLPRDEVRDPDDGMLRPGDRSDAAMDREITQKVRDALSSDSGMAAQARDVDVSMENGTLTLRGTVASEQERTQIESLARGAGATRIDNQLTIERDEAPNESDRG